MKRLTSIFLVLAMLLTLAPMNIFAAETDKSVFSDMKDTDYYAQAATALEQLDILAGYPDGTFGAEKSITRAEMAAIVCRMIDKEADAEKAKGETAFDDVKSDHWASGYINIASKEGIINGDGNGKFRPEDDVKHEEAIKMVVCALGYGDDVEVDAKDWSKGYLEVADEKGISAALKGTKGKASTRGDVAVMSYNGLSVDLAAPTTSLEAGSYRGTKSVKLSTTTEGAEIYYTTDGSTPTVKSTKYTKAISLSKTCTLKAITVKDGVLVSDVLSVDYTIKRSSGGGGGSYTPPTTATYTVSFDLNYEGATGAPASQTITSGNTATEPDAPTNGSYQFVGWFINKDETDLDNYYDFSTPVESNITLFAKWIDMTDTDSDGLVDGLEELYGTDKTLIDTDGDALNDYIEIFTFGTNPLLQDSDNNGTNDGDEDFDNDGLSNLTEINGSTNPADNDSDDDGLLDGEEITLGTNPNEEDTDEDGVSDSKEIELGTDPLVAQATFSMNLSADNDGEGATASVQMELSGEQVETLSIEPVDNETFFPETMPGYMGQAYDFNVEGEFDSADISFEFDASELGPDADPVIYYFNEETQELEELPTTINGNVATATVSHFSKYILVDRKVYQQSFTWIDNWESDQTYTGVEIILVVDDSGSMDWNDENNERLEVARDLIDKLPDNSKIGIVRFESGADKLTPEITEDKEYAKSFLTTSYFFASGGTYMYEGIDLAFSMFESTNEDIMKMMVVLSDGDAHDTYMHDSIVAKANDNKVKIYTVGLGSSSSSYFNNYLKPLATNTGGAFYLASDATQLADIYKDINDKIDIDTDSDEDGIPDYYEDNMIIFNGVKLSLDKNNPDTDGDGLLDGEEVIITKEPNADGTKVKVTGKLALGNPTKSDTDNDGYNDDEDGDWNIAYVTPVILLHGRGDNTNGCFGAKTDITSDINSHYGSGSVDYTNAENHKITHPITKNLAKTLQDNGYKANYSLFAFNYPNQDMAKLNAEKLDAYITDLVETAKSGNKNDVASASGIFPTKDQSFYQFDLIGHSNGGLVSRFYVENLGGSAHIRKVITIDTPHYGSGIAYGSDIIDIANIFTDCYPMDVDLNPASTLYNGGKKKVFVSLVDGARADYINQNQSPKLNGNAGLSTKYYALGGYDVSGQADGWFKEEMDNIPSNLRNTQFIFDFNLALGTMDAFNESIIKGYKTIDENIKLDLNDSSGDNVVNVRSQFGVKDKFGYIVEAVYFSKTSMTVDTVTGHSMTNHFHGKTQKNPLTMNKVIEYLSD